MSVRPFGVTGDGADVTEVSLGTASGVRASVLTLGACLRFLEIPLPTGERRRVTLGYPTLQGYLADEAYLGATVGRYASRIRDGRLHIGGRVHQLTLNDSGRHHLHGGMTGFSRRVWQVLADAADAVTLALFSSDGDQGYPGGLDVRCTYRLVEPATLRIVMTATADTETVVSLAHHSYFTLLPGRDIRHHRLRIAATHRIVMDGEALPNGEVRAVGGTRFDFTAVRPIAEGAGDMAYDDVFILGRADAGMAQAARLEAPDGSLGMDLYTTEPCLIFYDGTKLAGDAEGFDGLPYGPHAGLCLEPIRFPDSSNIPWFPSAVLDPGELYRQVTEYRFADAAR